MPIINVHEPYDSGIPTVNMVTLDSDQPYEFVGGVAKKRIKVYSVQVHNNGGGANTVEVYYGNAQGIAQSSTDAVAQLAVSATVTSKSIVFQKGFEPTGDVGEELSARVSTDAMQAVVIIQYGLVN